MYIGQFKDNHRDGFGTYETVRDGYSFYEGEYKKDLKDGVGKHTFGSYEIDPSGERKLVDVEVYEGEFKNNHYHGKGTFRYSTGDFFEGEYAEDLKNG